MRQGRQVRDVALLDALSALEPVAVDDTVWRVVRSDRDPLAASPAAGRWDPGRFDVLYASFERDGAVEEMHFHLSRQPVFPSAVSFTVNEIAVRTSNTLKFAELQQLAPLGVDAEGYSLLRYERTQAIGDAAAFLGFDGLIAPSARRPCLNLVVFTDRVDPEDLRLKGAELVDFAAWRRRQPA